MKNTFSALLLLLTAFSFSGCIKDKLTSLTDITFSQRYATDIDLPPEATSGTAVPLPIPGGSAALPDLNYPFETGIEQIAKDYNTSPQKLVAVKVDSFSLAALAPVGQNLDFINSIEIRLAAPGVPEVAIARKAAFPKGQNLVFLDVQDVNLKDFFLKDSLTVRVMANVNALPPLGTQLRLGNKYKITANPLK